MRRKEREMRRQEERDWTLCECAAYGAKLSAQTEIHRGEHLQRTAPGLLIILTAEHLAEEQWIQTEHLHSSTEPSKQS